MIYELIHDFTQALNAGPWIGDARQRLASIHKVLLQDGAFLARYPTTLQQTLSNAQVIESTTPFKRPWLKALKRPPQALNFQTINTPGGTVRTATFSADGTLIAVGTSRRLIRVLRADDYSLVDEFKVPAFPRKVVFSPDGTLIVCLLDESAFLVWDARTGMEIVKRSLHFRYGADLAISPNGQLLAVSSSEFNCLSLGARSIELYEVSNFTRLTHLQAEDGGVSDLAFHPDGRHLAGGGGIQGASWLYLFDVQTQKERWQRSLDESGVSALTFSLDGRALLVGSSAAKKLRAWEVGTGEILWERPWSTNALAISKDGRYLASGDSYPLFEHRPFPIHLIDLTTLEVSNTLHGHTLGINALMFSPQQPHLLLSASDDESVRLWDTTFKVAEVVETAHTSSINCLAWSPDDSLLATGSDDQTIRLWDSQTGQSVGLFEGHEQRVVCLAWHPDGTMLASGSQDGTVRFWDLQQRAYKFGAAFGKHCWIMGLSYSPTGRRMLVCTVDKKCYCWDIASGEVVWYHEFSDFDIPPASVVILPEGKRLQVNQTVYSIDWNADDLPQLHYLQAPDHTPKGLQPSATEASCELWLAVNGMNQVVGWCPWSLDDIAMAHSRHDWAGSIGPHLVLLQWKPES